jgi:putative MFS transporter
MSAAAPPPAGAASANEAAIGAAFDNLRNFRHGYWAPVLLGAIMLFDSWDAVAIAYAMPALAADWKLDPLTMGMLISSGYAGQFVGAVSLGAVAERFGRLPVFIVASALMSVLAIGCAMAPDPTALAIMRVLQGVMIGGAMPVAISYVNELAPTKTRGRYFGIFQTIAISGITIASLASPFVIPHLGWRWMFGLGALPLILLPLVWITLPESPRWLVRAGRLAAANKALAKLGAASIAFEKEAPVPGGAPKAKRLNVGALFSPQLRSRTLTVTMLWFLTIFVGAGMTNWAPSLYVKSFGIPVERALTFAAIVGVVIFFVLTISGWLIDKFGRRSLALGGLVFAAMPLLTLAAWRPSEDVGIFAMFLITQTAIFCATFTLWPYTAEIYPTSVRALGLGYGSSVGRGASMLMPLLVGFVMSKGAPIQIVLTIFGIFALTALVVWITRTHETAGKPLETS